jgi:hypothetical protein
MPWTSEHTKWLVDTGERLKTADGKEVEVWEFRHEKDEAVLSAWARHFRNHYCFDSEIDYSRRGYKWSRGEYLNTIKFPDPKNAPGPSIRAGDFGEVLVADFLEYLFGYIAQDLAASLNLAATQKKDIVKALKKDRDGARAVMEKYPIYFQERMNELLQ